MCTSPLKGFKFGKTDLGNDKYHIRPFNTDHIEIDKNGNIITCRIPQANLDNIVVREYTEIPCGKCLECKLNYSRQWAQRCVLEAQQYENNAFITLTYNDDHIPLKDIVLKDNGEVKTLKTLRKEDFQKFMKRFRKKLDPLNIRFFACGEYGEETKRPHYHAIIFNWFPNEDDLTLIGKNFNGDCYYSSKLLEEVWPYGYNIIAKASYETMAYVSRYVTKKQSKLIETYQNMNIEPEFILMSRRPGIGLNWYTNHSVCYANYNKSFISSGEKSITITSNKYFDKKLKLDDPLLFEDLKQKRKEFSEHKKRLKLKQTSLSYEDMLQVHDQNLKNKTKILQRKGV